MSVNSLFLLRFLLSPSLPSSSEDIKQALKATFDILRDENTSLLQTIKEIDAAYEAIAAEKRWNRSSEAVRRFDALLYNLPDRVWIE